MFGVSIQAVEYWLNGARKPIKTMGIVAALYIQRNGGHWPL